MKKKKRREKYKKVAGAGAQRGTPRLTASLILVPPFVAVFLIYFRFFFFFFSCFLSLSGGGAGSVAACTAAAARSARDCGLCAALHVQGNVHALLPGQRHVSVRHSVGPGGQRCAAAQVPAARRHGAVRPVSPEPVHHRYQGHQHPAGCHPVLQLDHHAYRPASRHAHAGPTKRNDNDGDDDDNNSNKEGKGEEGSRM